MCEMGGNIPLKLLGILIIPLFVLSLSADEGLWNVRFGLFSADSEYTDSWNFAGVFSTSSDEWDIYDIEKFLPPLPEWAAIYFPHSDPAEPDYWVWPNNKDYSSDIRAPLDSTTVWRMKIQCFYGHSKILTIWWSEMDSMPGSYLPLLVNTTDNDTINMRENDTYTGLFPPGIQRWMLIVQPDYYESMSVLPYGSVVRIGELRFFRAYLHHETDSILAGTASWEYHGSGGTIDENGYFRGVSPGGGYVIADIGGMRDSAEVTVVPGGDFFEINLVEGWNSISLPAVPSSNRIEDILPGIIPPVYTYNSVLKTAVATDTLALGRGYFVLSLTDSIYEFIGTELDTVVTELYPGWNFVGGPGNRIYYPGDFETYPPNIIIMQPHIFESGFYFATDSLRATDGFWVLSATTGILTITSD